MSKELLLNKLKELPKKLSEAGMDGRGIIKYQKCIDEIAAYIKANNIENPDDLNIESFWDVVDEEYKRHLILKNIVIKLFKYLRGELTFNELVERVQKRIQEKTNWQEVEEVATNENQNINENKKIEEVAMNKKEKDILNLETEVKLYKRDDNTGRLQFISSYTIKDIAPDGDVEKFIRDFIVPKFGGGVYELFKVERDGKQVPVRSYMFAKPETTGSPNIQSQIPVIKIEHEKDEGKQVQGSQALDKLSELVLNLMNTIIQGNVSGANKGEAADSVIKYQLARQMMADLQNMQKYGDISYIDRIERHISRLEELINKQQTSSNKNDTPSTSSSIDLNTILMKDMLSEMMNTIKDLRSELNKQRDKSSNQLDGVDMPPSRPYRDRYMYYDDYYPDPYYPPPRGMRYPLEEEKSIEDIRKEFEEKMYHFKEEIKSMIANTMQQLDLNKDRFNIKELVTAVAPFLAEIYKSKIEESKINNERMQKIIDLVVQQTITSKDKEISSLKDRLDDLYQAIYNLNMNQGQKTSNIRELVQEIKALKEASSLFSEGGSGEGKTSWVDKLLNFADKLPQAIESIKSLQQGEEGKQSQKQTTTNKQVTGTNVKKLPKASAQSSMITDEQVHETILKAIKDMQANPERLNDLRQILYTEDYTPYEEGIKVLLQQLNITPTPQLVEQIKRVLIKHKDEYISLLEGTDIQ